MGIGSLGISELLVIFVVVLVFFGPKRMPGSPGRWEVRCENSAAA